MMPGLQQSVKPAQRDATRPAARLAIRLASVLLPVLLIQLFVIPRWSRPAELERLLGGLERGAAVLYFGDSTNRWSTDHDGDRRAISEYLQQHIGEQHSVLAADGKAWHAAVFETLLRFTLRQEQQLRCVVVPINLRALSPEWYARPQYQFSTLRQYCDPSQPNWRRGLLQPLRMLGLQDADTLSQVEFEALPVMLGQRKVGTIGEFCGPVYRKASPELVRNKLILHYMSALTPEHPGLQAYCRIADLCRKHDIRCVFYVTPIDVVTGEQYLPGAFLATVRRNVGMLSKHLQNHGGLVVDLSDRLESTAFAYENYPNEHLRDTGRAFVARALVTAVAAAQEQRQWYAADARRERSRKIH
jgi:hypothetical protein